MAIQTGQLYDTASGSVQASLLNSLYLAATQTSANPTATSATVACSTGQGDPPKTYDTDFGNAAANYFCSQGGTRQISGSGTSHKAAIYGYQDQPDKKTDVALITRMYYVNADGCTAKSTQLYEPSIQECKDNFADAMNSCQTDTTTEKAASYKMFNKGDNGCVAFDFMPCPEVDGAASGDECKPNYGSYNDFKVNS